MPADDLLTSFGFVYGRSGTARGTTTSSGVFAFATGFSKRVVFAEAYEQGNGLRNNNADPAASTAMGAFAIFRPITANSTLPTQARFRVWRERGTSGGSFVRTVTLATVVTGITCRWIAHGY